MEIKIDSKGYITGWERDWEVVVSTNHNVGSYWIDVSKYKQLLKYKKRKELKIKDFQYMVYFIHKNGLVISCDPNITIRSNFLFNHSYMYEMRTCVKVYNPLTNKMNHINGYTYSVKKEEDLIVTLENVLSKNYNVNKIITQHKQVKPNNIKRCRKFIEWLKHNPNHKITYYFSGNNIIFKNQEYRDWQQAKQPFSIPPTTKIGKIDFSYNFDMFPLELITELPIDRVLEIKKALKEDIGTMNVELTNPDTDGWTRRDNPKKIMYRELMLVKIDELLKQGDELAKLGGLLI